MIVYGMILIMPEILLALGGKEYMEAKFILLPIALGAIYQFLYTLFVNIEQLQKKTLSMSIATVVTAIINCISNFIFINKFGYIAAAYTTVASYMILLAIHMGIVYKMGYSRVYDYKFVLLIALLGAIMIGITNALYLMTSIRIVISISYITVMLILIYKNKEKIIKDLK